VWDDSSAPTVCGVLANRDLTAELALDLAVAAGTFSVRRVPSPAPPPGVIGRDPRASGEFLSAR
jgi:phosphoglucosamine mutase